MDDGGEQLETGRRAFARQRWNEARERLVAADEQAPLAIADLDRLAAASYLSGLETEAAAVWRRAHHELVDAGDPAGAARRGFWLSLSLLLGGEGAQGAGWLARARRLLEGRPPCAEHGYLGIVDGLMTMSRGDAAAAAEAFERALELGSRFGEPDLQALALLSVGQARIQLGRAVEGVEALDEAMVNVTNGEVSPIVAGIVYCAVIMTCQRIFDLRRSSEWTLALDRWCGDQPELVTFREACLVHRSQVFQLKGEWSDALNEAQRACEWASERKRSVGRALYQLAEVQRLRGELAQAAETYREASLAGTEPQPGISLLRMAEGELEAAAASIRRVVDETSARQGPIGAMARAPLLAAYVEIMLAAGDLAAARGGAEALTEIADGAGVPYLTAMSRQALGGVQLEEGDPKAALGALRAAWDCWQELEVPYESARVRVLIARACRALGDADTASSHLDAAAAAFEQLGASWDLERLQSKAAPAPDERPDELLSRREREVLALLAAGKTNREIGAELFISEHTVARHVANMFNKLGVSSRTAAAAYAFEHGLT